MPLNSLQDSALGAIRGVRSYIGDLGTPTIRLGVTGLARAGKTVFITALVRNLVHGGRLPFLSAYADGRVARAFLAPQLDDAVPRFDYEGHLATLAQDPPAWPESTRQITQLRVTIEYAPVSALRRSIGARRLHLDIVDYPGEWLLDLALIGQSYEAFAREAIDLAREPARAGVAAPWLAHLASLDPAAAADEPKAIEAAKVFTAFLHQARAGAHALSTLGPGRFLLPGDLAGSPLVSFAPLDMPAGWTPPMGSLAAMMERRFESYKVHVVTPFFRNHFSRLDRQIVLVDALSAINAGADGVEDLKRALAACLKSFRPGTNSWLSALVGRRIDRVLFAATKADQLPQASHDRLEAALRHVTEAAASRAGASGAQISVVALASLRATREAERRAGGETMACIVGTPWPGERIAGRVFDGTAEAAIFPGDIPADLPAALANGAAHGGLDVLHFVRFRPPPIGDDPARTTPLPWPHIRLDRSLEFLIGDRLT